MTRISLTLHQVALFAVGRSGHAAAWRSGRGGREATALIY